ncbi:hypothetical protein TNCV_4008541 [Trichonephila clavipes]|nr:hypothetical protein TNCV_4008541 [Trichonephila clavipes]
MYLQRHSYYYSRAIALDQGWAVFDMFGPHQIFSRCCVPPIGLGEMSQKRTATAGSDVVQSGRPIFDDFFQHLWPYIGNNTANVVFQMVKHLWLIRIDQ